MRRKKDHVKYVLKKLRKKMIFYLIHADVLALVEQFI